MSDEIEKETVHELLMKVTFLENEYETMLEINRRLKAFDWYNKHYHLPDELKNLEKGVSLKETNLEGCQSEKKPFKEHEYNRFCDCLMCKETKQEEVK